jgi:hypothetical protein
MRAWALLCDFVMVGTSVVEPRQIARYRPHVRLLVASTSPRAFRAQRTLVGRIRRTWTRLPFGNFPESAATRSLPAQSSTSFDLNWTTRWTCQHAIRATGVAVVTHNKFPDRNSLCARSSWGVTRRRADSHCDLPAVESALTRGRSTTRRGDRGGWRSIRDALTGLEGWS